MTRAEIIAIQTELGVQTDGIWGPITAAAYAARMAQDAPQSPVALPPVSKPWWQSRTVIGLAACYGVTEASSRGSDPVSTILDAARTSKWGLIQATGNLWAWGRDRAGANSNTATEGRGSESSAPNASLFGGDWGSGTISGSRCSFWNGAASDSNVNIGSRFACDHLMLVT